MLSGTCKTHRPEVNPLLVPLIKLCSSCGQSESLDRDEICWPSQVRFYTRRNWRSFRSSLYGVPVLLIAIAALFLIVQSQSRKKPSNEASDSGKERSIASTQARFAVSSVTPMSEDPFSPLTESRRSPAREDELEQAKKDTAPQETIISAIESPATSDSSVADGVGSRSEPNVPKSAVHEIEARITKLITDRAIPGVRVTVANDTVHLNGAVKTQNQKLSAEQAAKSVHGIKDVRNMLRVEWQGANS